MKAIYPRDLDQIRLTKRGRANGTGEWIFDHDTFKEWLRQPEPQIIALTGAAGVGKSVLAKHVSDTLALKQPDAIVVEVFCQATHNTAVYIMRAVLHQLLSHRRELFSHVYQQQQKHELDQLDSFGSLWKLLLLLLNDNEIPPVFCIIDGLDECQLDAQEEFLSVLYRDFQRRDTLDQLDSRRGRFFLTSRENNLTLDFSKRSSHWISITPRDIEPDMRTYIKQECRAFDIQEHKLAQLISAILTHFSEGMFLHVFLVFDEFRTKKRQLSVEGLIQTVVKAPKKLFSRYERMILAIPEASRSRARKIFQVLLFSAHLLTVEEFSNAMIDLPDAPTTHGELMHKKNWLATFEARDLCGALVTISDGLIYLSHDSIRQFLLSNSIMTFNESQANLELATLCIRYLLLESVDISQLDGRFPYLIEATAAWPIHICRAGSAISTIEALLREFFGSERVVESLRAWTGFQTLFEETHFDRNWALLQALAVFGLVNVLERTNGVNPILNLDVGARETGADGFTLLNIAIHSAQVDDNKKKDLVLALLRLGVDPRTRSKIRSTALHDAAHEGLMDVTDLLIPLMESIDCEDNKSTTPLMWAAEQGHDGVVSLLVERGADLLATNENGSTALHVAAGNGHEECVQILLKHGAQSTGDSEGITPLHAAAAAGMVGCVRLLLNAYPTVDIRDKVGLTPLHLAAHFQHDNTVRLLLNMGADVNCMDSAATSALHLAASQGAFDIVKILLVRGAEADIPDEDGDTPLFLAASCDHEDKCGHLEVVIALLDHGADVNYVSDDSKSVLSAACRKNNLKIVQLLVSRNADVTFLGHDESPMLETAIFYDHEDLALYLIEHGAPLFMRFKHYSPLWVAAWQNRRRIVAKLLEKTVIIQGISPGGTTLLHHAADNDMLDLLNRCLGSGISVDVRTDLKWTPLHLAAARGNLVIVTVLLKAGAKLNATTDDGSTALILALSNKHQEVAELLLEQPTIDVAMTTTRGWTPMHIAAERGFTQMIHTLRARGMPVDSATSDGLQPLMLATHHGHIAAVEALLGYDADPRCRAEDGWQPIHWAAVRHHEKLMRILLEAGVDPNDMTYDNETPLLLCCAGGDPHTIRLLQKHGALANIHNRKERIALHRATHARNFPALQILLDMGEDSNRADLYDFTPTQLAAANYDLLALEKLVAYGGNLHTIDGYGRSSLYYLQAITDKYPAPTLLSERDRRHLLTNQALHLRKTILEQDCRDDWPINTLAKTLGYLDLLEDAAICEEHTIKLQEGQTVHDCVCDATAKPHSIVGVRRTCRVCTNYDLCEEHYQEYLRGKLTLKGCRGHDFLKVPRDIYHDLNEKEVDEEGHTFQEWLEALDSYILEIGE